MTRLIFLLSGVCIDRHGAKARDGDQTYFEQQQQRFGDDADGACCGDDVRACVMKTMRGNRPDRQGAISGFEKTLLSRNAIIAQTGGGRGGTRGGLGTDGGWGEGSGAGEAVVRARGRRGGEGVGRRTGG